MNLERYKFIQDSFIDSVKFKHQKIFLNDEKLNTIDNSIPNFINEEIDDLTMKMSNFYNEVQFPNYDDFEDYASLYDKGINNIFTKRLDEEIGYGSKVLELGCGTGQLSLFLSRCNREIYSVDISNSSLKLGEDFRKSNNIENTFFMKMDVFDLKFKKNNFDFVISNGVLHHTKDAKRAFKSLVEVTKPGGIIVIGLYHRYGRIFTRIKQKIARILGNKVAYLDKKSRNIKSKNKRLSWVKDQFMNPHETLHTPDETIDWFNENNVEFLNLIPHYDIKNGKLFMKNKVPKISKIKEILMGIDSVQIQEGGFFVIVGKKI